MTGPQTGPVKISSGLFRISTGSRIGPYEVVAPLGAGGMGEVFRARDLRLGREVAVKVLPEAFASDPDRLARFQREAQVLASLNHPNIAAIYGLEETADTKALVLELVPGETVAERIVRGAIPVHDALVIAKQIADALEAAHEQGIIHRDLKPANIKISPDGVVKVLDFGLAKLAEQTSETTSSSTVSMSPTITSPAQMTNAGMILGTAAYMAPEQAKGRPATKAADIWSFGCVFYEMLTARRAFVGEDVSDTLAAVLRAEPDWSALSDDVPPAVRRLLRRCLQKDSRHRLAHIADARLEIVDARDNTADEIAGEQTKATPPRWRLGIALPAAGIGVLVAVAALGLAMRSPAVEPAALWRVHLAPPENVTIPPGPPQISPDGRLVAFVGRGADAIPRIYLRLLHAPEPTPLPGTEGAWGRGASLIWSPDSRQLTFQSGTSVKKIAVVGGLPQPLCDLPSAATIVGGSWNRDGVIILGTNVRTGLLRVPQGGGRCEPLTRMEPLEANHLLPVFLPDGRHFLYLRAGRGGDQIYVGSLDAPPEQQKIKRVLITQFGAQYVPVAGEKAGWLLFVRDATLFAQAFDADRLELSGDAVPLAASIGTLFNIAYFSASSNGVLVYRTSESNHMQLTWFDRQGQMVSEVGDPIFPRFVSVSPDGTQAAFDSFLPPAGGWLMDLRTGIRRRVGIPGNLAWSPTAEYVAYSRPDIVAEGRGGVFRRRVSGGDEELLVQSSDSITSMDWSRDGQFLVYAAVNAQTNGDIWALRLDRSTKPFVLAHSVHNEVGAKLSPDSRWVAYMSDESGSNEIYIRRFSPSSTDPGTESAGTLPVSKGGVSSLLGWRDDSKELWYVTTDLKIMRVELTLKAGAVASEPSLLFEMPPGTSAPSTDGRRFLLAVPTRRSLQLPFDLILNWPALMTG